MNESLATVATVAALTALPLLLVASTSFVKLSIVFSVVRNAIGLGSVPSGLVISALAAILSVYVMAPVGAQIAEATATPLGRLDPAHPFQGESLQAILDTIKAGKEPLRAFLVRNAGARELALFLRLAKAGRPPAQRAGVVANDLSIVMPGFLITELKEAFHIGFLVLLPFLVIDLVVASVLLSLGMNALGPAAVSLPFKLLLFVLVDGWYVLSEALVAGYA